MYVYSLEQYLAHSAFSMLTTLITPVIIFHVIFILPQLNFVIKTCQAYPFPIGLMRS